MKDSLNKQTEYETLIEKFVPEGKALARVDGKVVFVLGGLPREKVKIRITKNKKNYSEGIVTEIIERSPERIEPKEEHYLICSPWQVLDYENQIKYKKDILTQAFLDRANENIEIDKFYESKTKYGYRTKLEFSFTENNESKIALAFHKRGTQNEYEVISGCELGSPKMNEVANKICDILNNTPDIAAKGLKSLTIRESKTNGKIIAVLLHKFKEYEINFTLADLDGLVSGLVIGYSTIKSPISVITELKYSEGELFLEEQVLNARIRYPYDGFFQNNLEVFNKALTEIRKAMPEKVNKITEIYSGAGTIGFNISDKANELVGIEIVLSAVEYAGINKNLNNIDNYREIELPDHKIKAEDIEGTDILVLDPPRSGMHPKLIKRVLETLPEKIIYLSCNPVTQARDYNDLKDKYKITKLVGFDFYPNTLHLESLIVLERK